MSVTDIPMAVPPKPNRVQRFGFAYDPLNPLCAGLRRRGGLTL